MGESLVSPALYVGTLTQGTLERTNTAMQNLDELRDIEERLLRERDEV